MAERPAGSEESCWRLPKIAFGRPPLSDSLSARRTLVARSEWLFICKVVEAVFAAKAPKGTFGAKSF